MVWNDKMTKYELGKVKCFFSAAPFFIGFIVSFLYYNIITIFPSTYFDFDKIPKCVYTIDMLCVYAMTLIFVKDSFAPIEHTQQFKRYKRLGYIAALDSVIYAFKITWLISVISSIYQYSAVSFFELYLYLVIIIQASVISYASHKLSKPQID